MCGRSAVGWGHVSWGSVSGSVAFIRGVARCQQGLRLCIHLYKVVLVREKTFCIQLFLVLKRNL